MNRKWFVFFIILAMCLAVKARAADQTDRSQIQKEFEAADTNKDGYVSEKEYESYIRRKAALHNSEKEEKNVEHTAAGREGEKFVTKGEEEKGRVSFKELLNGRLRFFNEADANKDSLLSLQEYTRMKLLNPAR